MVRLFVLLLLDVPLCSWTLFLQEGGDNWIEWMRSLPGFVRKLLAGGSTVKAELQPGDVLVYDSRLLHRGQG